MPLKCYLPAASFPFHAYWLDALSSSSIRDNVQHSSRSRIECSSVAIVVTMISLIFRRLLSNLQDYQIFHALGSGLLAATTFNFNCFVIEGGRA